MTNGGEPDVGADVPQPVGMQQDQKLKDCRYCGTSLPRTALICKECKNWLDWRAYVNFGVPVLSLVLAILTVTFSSGREFFEKITYRPKVDFVFSGFSFSKNPEAGEIPQTLPHEAEILLVNSEDRFVVISRKLTCIVSDFERPSVKVDATLSMWPEIQGKMFFGDYWAIASKSQVLLKYSTIGFGGRGEMDQINEHNPGDSKTHGGKADEITIACDIEYLFDGKRYSQPINRQQFADEPRDTSLADGLSK